MLLACLRLMTQGTQLSLSLFTKGTCPEQRKRGQTHFSLFTSFSYLEGLDMCSISDNSFHEAAVIFMMSRHARTRWFQKRNGVHILRIMNKLFREGEQMGGVLQKSQQIRPNCSSRALNLCLLPERPLSRYGNFPFHVWIDRLSQRILVRILH